MRIKTQLTISDAKIREIVIQEMKKFEFEEIGKIKMRLDKLEESDKIYSKFVIKHG